MHSFTQKNVLFRLISNWNAGSLLHKEMIAVLAAVSDVLKTYGGKETETEYFAALVSIYLFQLNVEKKKNSCSLTKL